jgi:hypothetical protein
VAEDARRRGNGDLAVQQVQVGAANAACADLEQELALRRTRHLALYFSQRAPNALEDDRAHRLCGRVMLHLDLSEPAPSCAMGQRVGAR